LLANFTPDEKEKYTEGQKMIYDYQNCIDFAKEQGLAEGEVKGKLETAKNIIKMGLSITRICLSDWSYRKRYRKSSSSLTP